MTTVPVGGSSRVCADDGSEWGMMARPMRGADAETRKCLAFCEDIEGDPPTIGELLNAQAAAGEGA
jgi:hypothetical protein